MQARQRAGTYLEPKSFFPQVLACRRRPPRDTLRLAGSMHIVPAWAAAVIAPATPLHMHDWSGFLPVRGTTPGCSLSHYVLFDVQGHVRIRRAVADWTLTEIIADVLSLLPDTVSIRVLARILPGLPALQLVARPRSAPAEMGVLPVDLRPTGGMICTLLVPGGATQQDVVHKVVNECRTPPVDLSVARGGVFARLPLVADDADHLHSGAPTAQATRPGPVTTTTTTEVMAWAGGAPMDMPHRITVLTRHGPVEGAVLSGRADLPSQLEPILTHILRYGHAPRQSAVVLARVQPTTQDRTFQTLFIWANRCPRVASVVVDRRLLGQGLDLVEVPEGTEPRHLLTAQDRQQGFEFSVNGVAAPAWRRWLRTGDVIQLMRTRISPPVWSTGFVMDFFPEARAFTVPLHLLDVEPVAAEVPDDNLAVANAASIRGQLEYFMARRLDELGRPGLGTHHVVVQGPTHGDLYLHISQPLTPDVAQVEEYLQATTFWDRQLLVHDTDHSVGYVSYFASSQPNTRLYTALVPTPTVDSTLVFQIDPHEPHLSRHVFLMGHLRPAPVRRLRQGLFIEMRHVDLPQEPGLQLLQTHVQVRRKASPDVTVLPRRPADMHSAVEGGSLSILPAPPRVSDAPQSSGLRVLSVQGRMRRTEASADVAPCLNSTNPCQAVEGGSMSILPAPLTAHNVVTPFGRRQLHAALQLGPAPTPLPASQPFSVAGPVGTEPTSDVTGVEVLAVAAEGFGVPASLSVAGHTSLAPGSPQTQVPACVLHLDQLIPHVSAPAVPLAGTPEASLQFPLPDDIEQHAFEGFEIAQCQRQVSPEVVLHPAAASLLQGLPVASVGSRPEALMCFVDGSFDGHAAAWAVACVGLHLGQWHWFGYRSGPLPTRLEAGSVFPAEVFAQFVALGTIASCAVPGAIFYDSQSAALVSHAATALVAQDPLTAAAASLTAYIRVQRRQLAFVYTKSHVHHPGNELADGLAVAARKAPGTAAPLDFDVARDILERSYDWLWLRPAARSHSVWPSVDADGATVPCGRASAAVYPTPAAWAALPETAPTASRTCIQAEFLTYNTLSCRTSLQRHCLQAFMLGRRASVLALQETRQDAEPISQVGPVIRVASQPDQGQLPLGSGKAIYYF